MKRLVLLATAGLVALALPTSALAAPQKGTVNAGVVNGALTSTSGAGAVNTVTLTSAFGVTVISDTTGASGTPVGTDCGFLSSTTAYCLASSASIQTLDLDDSIVNKSALPGTLDGGAGNDTVTGADAAETLRGGDGNDTITGGGGADTIEAGAGDDRIDAKDGLADTVDCGAGNDTAVVDAGDVLTGCESVTGAAEVTPVQPPASTPDAGTGAGGELSAPRLLSPLTVIGPVVAKVAVGSKVSVNAKGVAPFVLGCTPDQPKACTGAIFIDPVPAKAKGKRKGKKAKTSAARAFMARRGRYGSSPFKVRPGEEGSTQVKLTGVAMRAIGKSRGKRARSARRGRPVAAFVTIAPKNTRAQRVRITLRG